MLNFKNIPYLYMSKIISAIVCVFLFGNACFAQSTDVFRGVLIDDETSQPIVDVHIYSTSGYVAVSNYDGSFSIAVLPNDTLNVSSVGYAKTTILVENCPDFTDKILTFKIKPIVYTLRAVEINPERSIVVLPEEILKSVDIGDVEGVESSVPKISVGDYTSILLQNAKYDKGLPFFGIGITINGFLSGFMKEGTKEERMVKELSKVDENQKVFYNYVYSSDLKKILMENYKMTESEYQNFIDYFVKNAGNVKKSNNEYDILQAIIEKIDKMQN